MLNLRCYMYCQIVICVNKLVWGFFFFFYAQAILEAHLFQPHPKFFLKFQTRVQIINANFCRWPLTYGKGVAGGLAVVSGAIFNAYLRQKLKLFNQYRFSTMFSSCIIPALTASLLEMKTAMEPILLRDYDCPLCVQMRAAAWQVM